MRKRLKHGISKNIIYSIALFFYALFSLMMFNSCELISLYDGGNHASIESYKYMVSRDSLLNCINKVVERDNIAKLDADDPTDTYINIHIRAKKNYSFTFRFYGDKDYWINHPESSRIFITSIKIGNGLYKEKKDLNKKEKEDALMVFDMFFIKEIEKECGLKSISNSSDLD